MKTEDLIKALAADASAPAMPVRRAWSLATAVATAIAVLVLFSTIGVRPDIAAASETLRFLFKPAATIVLAATALKALAALSRPDVEAGVMLRLLAAPFLLVAAVLAELIVVPSSEWGVRLIGTNGMVCLTYIPLIGSGPLAVFLAALRHGAPTRPARAGAVAGLLAGGIAATFYAMHCTDDSPLFVATWYTTAIAGLALLGALLAPRIARW